MSRPLWLRLTAGLVVTGAGLGAFALAWATLFSWWWTLTPLLVAFVLAFASPFAAWPLVTGRWSREAWIVPQVGAFALTLLIYVGVALVAASRALMALTTRDDYGTPALQCAAWLALTAAAVLVIATLVAAVPLDERDGLLIVVAAALGVAGLAGAGGAVAVAAGPSSCEQFAFDRGAWKRDRAPVADALVRCRTLVGLDEREMQRLLGGRLGRTEWHAGYVDDGFFGARQRLSVQYGRDGRVRSARLDAFHL
ncbi:hypothetical protein OJ998_16875 [Solirubrobacter taibaiensis]|nr:hypothetical protein [Solirubrobacter taibaiensis]